MEQEEEAVNLSSLPQPEFESAEWDHLPWQQVPLHEDGGGKSVGYWQEYGLHSLETLPGDAYDVIKGELGEVNIENSEQDSTTKQKRKKAKKKKKSQPTVESTTDNTPTMTTGVEPLRDDDSQAEKRPSEDAGLFEEGPRATKKQKTGKQSKKGASTKDATNVLPPALQESLERVENGWSHITLHPHLKENLARSGFYDPTPIQEASIPTAITHYKDVLGAAETGSGKTLAYGLPIIHRLLQRREKMGMDTLTDETGSKTKNVTARWTTLPALIVTPTRELAVQVKKHLSAMAEGTYIRVEIIVGGLAMQKQERVLSNRPDIIVGTPGRLWELIRNGYPFLNDLPSLQFLVLDEADKLVERGHFVDLTNILEQINPTSEPGDEDEDNVTMPKNDAVESESEEHKIREIDPKKSWQRQTLLFSATLGMGTRKTQEDTAMALLDAKLRDSGKKGSGDGKQGISKNMRRKLKKQVTQLSPVEAILQRVGIDKEPSIINVADESSQFTRDGQTHETGKEEEASYYLRTGKEALEGGNEEETAEVKRVNLPAGLSLGKVACEQNAKNESLYHFLLFHRGKALIFVNTINSLRKVSTLLSVLKLKVYSLHAQMQQKQRLKNVDGFNSSEDGILVATDVAARGLDLSLVDIVIHYSLPHSAETFVHRSGRTARARRSGFAVALVGPEDQKRYWQITKVLDFPRGFPDVALDHKHHKRIKARTNLATKIQQHILKVNKEHAQYLWLKKTIDNADTTVDDYTLEELESRERDLNDAKDDSGSDRSVKIAKKELNYLLKQPLVQKGTSLKYIASSRSDVAPTLLNSSATADTNGNRDDLLQRLMDSNSGVRRHVGGFNVDVGKGGKKKANKGKKGILTKDDIDQAAKEATIG
eukprot:gb/GECG01010403.1/.p1 GENE.gb/GECG01010403.1/~~gb/GECG01010403.1/.p1  ORF type:complete len:882 (+),score=149.46 gb/GECG01010403.1/:1-2646(+)